MTMCKALHCRDDEDRLYLSRKEGRGFASIQGIIEFLKITLENAEEDWWQRPETIQTTQTSTEQKLQENNKGKEKLQYKYFKR